MIYKSKINKILKDIVRSRDTDALFQGYTDENETDSKIIPSIFISILVSRILLESSEISRYSDYDLSTEIKKACEPTIKTIKKEQSKNGLWNYWKQNSLEYENKALPDDLDDTFNGLLIFNLYDYKNTTHKILSLTTRILLKTERIFDNLVAYNTWISDIENIDPVVQVVIFKFLSKIRSVPHQFESFIVKMLSRLEISIPKSEYYENSLYVLMELSSLPFAKEHAQSFKRYLNKVPKDSFDKILFYHIKNNLGILKNSDLEEISNLDHRDKSPSRIFTEKDTKDIKTYCYSKAVRSALYLKLLCSIKDEEEHKRFNQDRQISNIILRNVTSKVTKILKIFNTNIQNIDKDLFENHSPINRIIKETILWVRMINKNEVTKKDISFIEKLVEHTYFGWIGYTAIDSTIDDQISKDYFVLGNHFAIKSSIIVFDSINLIESKTNRILGNLKAFVDKIYTDLHTSHYLESKGGLKEDKEIIFIMSNKSIGHSISYLLIYIMYGKNNKEDLYHIYNYFYQYLTMRQLSDDIHDWKIDLKYNRVTYPTSLLKKINKKYHEKYINDTIMNKVLKLMKISDTSMQKSIFSLRTILSKESQQYLINDTQKYIRGIEHATKEIKLYKELKKI